MFCYTPVVENIDRRGDGVLCPMAIIIRDGKILLGLRNYTPDKWKDISVWTVPGGRSEKGETIGETLLREITEEVGITDLKIERFVEERPGVKPPDIVLIYRCSTLEEPKLMEPEKFSGWKWFGVDEIPENFINPDALDTIKREMSR